MTAYKYPNWAEAWTVLAACAHPKAISAEALCWGGQLCKDYLL